MKAGSHKECASSFGVMLPSSLWVLLLFSVLSPFAGAASTNDSSCTSVELRCSERLWERYVTDVDNDKIAKARISDYFVKTIPKEIAKSPGISASIVDIGYYNRLAKIRGFKRIPERNHVAYLIYTHRDIHKSLKSPKDRHNTRWGTVRTLIDKLFSKRVLTVSIKDDGEASPLWCSRFDYKVENLHDITNNAFDEIEKMVLYIDLRKKTESTYSHYDVMSLANATPDIALLGYDRQYKNMKNVVVMVHRTRGSWIQFASLVTIQLLDQREPPVSYKLEKDMTLFKTCYEALGAKLDTSGFTDQEWRSVCVNPDNLETHALLTFEDYLWEFFNVDVKRVHPYQQSVLIVLCSALRHAVSMLPTIDQALGDTKDVFEGLLTAKTVGPYLSVVKRMVYPRMISSPFLTKLFTGLAITRTEYIFGVWLAYIKAINTVRNQLKTVVFEEYMQSLSPAPIFSDMHRTIILVLACVTGASFFTALLMAIVRCCKRRRNIMFQRKQTMMFGSNSEIEYESDTASRVSSEDDKKMKIQPVGVTS